jgi:FtsP/CotA-like multicopper oxidase with cupredoxin domain
LSADKSSKGINRRSFIKLLAAAGIGLVEGIGLAEYVLPPVATPTTLTTTVTSTLTATGSFPGSQTALDGAAIPKYVDPVPTFIGARVDASKNRDLVVNNLEFQQKILPENFYSGLGEPYNQGTYVWGYAVNDGQKTFGPLYPAFTIEAKRHTPLRVTYVNSLTNTYLQQHLTVDQTVHWANPLGLAMDSPAAMKRYAGPIPVVTHLHGAEVPSTSDGGPDAWFTPAYAVKGPAWSSGVTQNYTYPNEQEATTLFFHDHALGATRLNLYAGLLGFYFIRDEYDTGIPSTGLNLPAGPYEIELAIQDKMFDENGQLLFPDGTGANADGSIPAGFNGSPPNPDTHPFWIPEFLGDVVVVNGKSWPYLNVEPRRYRFRIVDGANARFFNLTIPGVRTWVIGTDGGLLDKPVSVDSIFLAPGERADVIVDFSSAAGQSIIMTNDAPGPFPNGGGDPPNFKVTVGQIMKFIVGTTVTGEGDTSFDPSVSGATLRGGSQQSPSMVRLADGIGGITSGVSIDKYRMLTLNELPLHTLLNNTLWAGMRPPAGTPIPGFVQVGPNYLSELPQVGATERWDIVNMTGMAHPIHLHLIQFQLVNRQNCNLAGYINLYNSSFSGGQYIADYGPPLDYNEPNAAGAFGGNPDVTPFLQDAPEPPQPWEVGWKDTFKMLPGQVTRIIVRWAPQNVTVNAASAGHNKYSFDPTVGPGYVWHCHIVDHEDNEMMRPYKVQP